MPRSCTQWVWSQLFLQFHYFTCPSPNHVASQTKSSLRCISDPCLQVCLGYSFSLLLYVDFVNQLEKLIGYRLEMQGIFIILNLLVYEYSSSLIFRSFMTSVKSNQQSFCKKDCTHYFAHILPEILCFGDYLWHLMILLYLQKMKIMASSPITSWQIDAEAMETLTDFIFLGSKITADGDCSHEIKRHLLLERKAITNLGSILKNRDITLPTKVHLVKAIVFSVVMYGCESWTIKKAEN